MPSAGLAPRRIVQLVSAVRDVRALHGPARRRAAARTSRCSSPRRAAGLALDSYLQHKQPGLLSLLGKIRFDVTVRQLLRDMLILVGLLRIDGIEPLARAVAAARSRCSPSTRCTSPARRSPSWSAAPARCRSSPGTSTPPRCA